MELIAQVDASNSTWISILTIIGSVGFSVWYGYYNTTVTIPKMQDEHRSERKELVATIKTITDEFRTELKSEREHREKQADANREAFECRASCPICNSGTENGKPTPLPKRN